MPGLTAPAELPVEHRARFDAIAEENGGTRGCWDVYAWYDDDVLFAEAKRRGRDRLRPSQHQWLAAALRAGVPLDAFIVVEWNLSL